MGFINLLHFPQKPDIAKIILRGSDANYINLGKDQQKNRKCTEISRVSTVYSMNDANLKRI